LQQSDSHGKLAGRKDEMLLLTIDRKSRTPAYRQIIDAVVRLVDGGSLAAGDRLPPSRVLARSAGIHRSTVTRAYEDLWALGYLESRPGSYSTIRRRARRLTDTQRSRPVLDWLARVVPAARGARESAALLSRDRLQKADSRVLDFSRLTADVRMTPTDAVRRCFKAVLREDGSRALQYGEPAGFRPLRETIAQRLRTHAVDVSPEEIVITGGAQQAVDLLLRALVRRGDAIALESPTYSVAVHLFRFHGLDVRGVPVGPAGLDLDRLEQTVKRRRPALLYTIPNFHNPTGITTSQAHRERLLAFCERHRLPIVEDGFEEEMKYFGKAVLPIKSMDRGGIVAYVGTLSKVVSPGLRIGWIAAPPPLAEHVQAVQRLSSLSGNHLSQAAVHRFFATGAYEAHLRRVHKTYRRRMQAMVDGLREHLPKSGVTWTEPQGGYTLWLQVKGTRLSEQTLHDRLLAAGVKLSSGHLYYTHPPRIPSFRISVACSTSEEISEGCRRLGRVLRAAVRG
jgi:GntR family transcriptional regulator/MocR family aminotransferase